MRRQRPREAPMQVRVQVQVQVQMQFLAVGRQAAWAYGFFSGEVHASDPGVPQRGSLLVVPGSDKVQGRNSCNPETVADVVGMEYTYWNNACLNIKNY